MKINKQFHQHILERLFIKLDRLFKVLMGFFYFGGCVVGVFEQFGVSVYRTMRGRGAYICETSKGIKLLRETTCKEEKYAKEDYITLELQKNGFNYVDSFCRSVLGEILVEDEDKKKYYLKNWFDAGECDVKSYHDVIGAIGAIASVHKHLLEVGLNDVAFGIPENKSLEERYGGKLKEMRSVSNYLKGKKGKTDFERSAYEQMKTYFSEGEVAYERLMNSNYSKLYNEAVSGKIIAHGACNHHNILNGRGYVAVVNFERANINIQITDLYDFMRKILEKYDWDIKLAYKMIDEYNKVKTISDDELNVLGIMFAFPEKFFKIMNHYYNSSKAWIPDKDIEKLKNVIKQNESRRRFVESLK